MKFIKFSAEKETCIDVFIPAIDKDVLVLPYVIKSLKKIKHHINKVFIISNNNKDIVNYCKRNNLVYVFEEDLFPLKKKELNYYPQNIDRNGWLYQQFLKLSIDKIGGSNYFLILDSDTVFMKRQSFLYKNKIILHYSKEEKHLPYYLFIKKVFPEYSIYNYSFVTHHFFLEKNILTMLKSEIEERTNLNWYTAILGSIDYNEFSSFSEYELLGNYYYNNYKDRIYLSDFKNISVSSSCFFSNRIKMKIFSLYFKSCSVHQR